MAKNTKAESVFDVTGILPKQEKKKTNTHTHTHTHTPQNDVVENTPVPVRAPEEARSKRVQILIKPSTNEKIDNLVAKGKIKSKNDLINYLLESFLKTTTADGVEVADGTIRPDGQFRGQLSIEDM